MSTILKALQKLEENQTERQFPATPELEGEVAAGKEGAGSRPWRRIALVVAAVLLSGVAGVGVTLAGLSYWQASLFDSENAAVAADATADDVAVVAANTSAKNASDSALEVAPKQAAPVAMPQLAEEATVVIVADILERRAAATVDPLDSLPVAILTRKPAARLAAVRETRVSRVPKAVEPPLARDEPAPTRREPVAIASVRVEAASPKPVRAPVVAVEPTKVAAAVLPEIRPKVTPKLSQDITPEFIPEIVRAPVPSVVVMRTIWHPRPERRRAELSVEEGGATRTLELREGDYVGPLKLSEIGPLGVTFVLEGVEIQHRVGGTHR